MNAGETCCTACQPYDQTNFASTFTGGGFGPRDLGGKCACLDLSGVSDYQYSQGQKDIRLTDQGDCVRLTGARNDIYARRPRRDRVFPSRRLAQAYGGNDAIYTSGDDNKHVARPGAALLFLEYGSRSAGRRRGDSPRRSFATQGRLSQIASSPRSCD